MDLVLSSAEGLTPSNMIAKLRLCVFEAQNGNVPLAGKFGFADIFQFNWQEEPFEVSLVPVSPGKSEAIILPHLWIEKAMAGARMAPEEEEKVEKGKFVCVFYRESPSGLAKLLYIAPYTDEIEPLLDFRAMAEKRSDELFSSLGAIKTNIWF